MAENQAAAPDKDNAAAAEPTAKEGSLLTGEGEGTTSSTEGDTPKLPHAWMNGLTTEQKADVELIKNLSKFEKGIPDLAKSYGELSSKLSQALVVPNETATEEERARFRKAIGVPEKSEDYKLEKPKLPGGLEYDEDVEKDLLALAHKLNMSNEQADAVHTFYSTTLAKQIMDARKVVKTTEAEAEAQLRKDLGADYDAAQTYKERAFKEFFSEDGLAQLFVQTGLGNHPGIIKAFVKMGKAFSEHGFVDGSRGANVESGEIGKRSFDEIASTIYGQGNQQ